MYTVSIIGLIISILIAQAAGFIGSVFIMPTIPGWYDALIKPSFNPPAYIFAPVWSVLYTLMGLAAFRVWERKTTKSAKRALILYGIQLVLNVLWSYAFFGLYNPLAGLGVIVLLWLTIFGTMVLFYRIDKTAGWLMVPYLAWVSFASVFNYSLWMLN